MSRIEQVFASLTSQQRCALIPFFTVGDPELSTCLPTMHAMVAAGADIIELGIPFSDPMADGPVIQRASERALKNKVRLIDVLNTVKEFRQTNNHTPLVLMGYANPIERMGVSTFVKNCHDVGVDGVLVVDYPPAEAKLLADALNPFSIDPIFLIAPTTTDERVEDIARMAKGYVYYVSLRGVTGASHIDVQDVQAQVARIKRHVSIPVGVGFGIRDGDTARAIGQFSDAVVVGSRIVETIEQAETKKIPQEVGKLIQELRQALDNTL
ncbi:MAG: tryptophan synthase subunit alpha [Ferrovum sp. 37-45-19]|uniref:tryptophan synthase subunit alpha n=1 Tax=Ferrovum sp. JA12 TaxID=1356299 RepID=UPI000702750D|nr:tryptophan synthase subunit alpha [Ferrovum sp. JA12]OYV80243.1 MAG: tryptophan synthase subunit alpha [Ferrovum sp. 21-44-67]OYV94520.1 MAG: tryptophan synthase subunit alpha [Ferrovum sp. 37-45-19]OZB33861.1 MAG: tryptophan synthase subunit alpha [Ferrovum sp. 34-44-207]HQT81580.1 tryptophan synthase subunit alpha [Ferrovaceae bacterium]KRH78925.1 tryptophan synthase alpha chain [Ferrovum sp. JA12]